MGGSMTKGMYGAFGGQYAPETLMIALEELENAYEQVRMMRISSRSFSFI